MQIYKKKPPVPKFSLGQVVFYMAEGANYNIEFLPMVIQFISINPSGTVSYTGYKLKIINSKVYVDDADRKKKVRFMERHLVANLRDVQSYSRKVNIRIRERLIKDHQRMIEETNLCLNLTEYNSITEAVNADN